MEDGLYLELVPHNQHFACLFFLTEAKIPDRVATCNSGGVHRVCLFIFPDRVATGGVHGVCLTIFPDRGQNS